MDWSWVENPVITLSGWIIGLAGLLLSVYFGLKGKKTKNLSCKILKSDRLIDRGERKIPKLRLFFEDKEIEDITVTTCAIWNTGTETINFSDIVSEQGMKIFSEENSRILDAQILTSNKFTNKIQLTSVKDTEVQLDFEYMDTNQGATLQIIHEGVPIYFECEIKGGKFINKSNSERLKRLFWEMTTPVTLEKYALICSFYFFLIFVFYFISWLDSTGIISLPDTITKSEWYEFIFSSSVGITQLVFVFCLCAIGMLFTLYIVYKSMNLEVPKDLRNALAKGKRLEYHKKTVVGILMEMLGINEIDDS